VHVSEHIRVLIVDDIAETRENLRKLLSFAPDIEVVGAAASGEEGIELAKQFQPHIILMDINMPGMDGIAATEAILQEVPMTQVVVLSVQGESDYLRRAMLAGARDFLTKPPSGDELMGTIRQVYETGKKRAAVMMPVQQAAPTQTIIEPEDGQRDGKLIVIYSPKGGVGCTTIAVNLAIALREKTNPATTIGLMDANLQFGDVGVMLNLPASRSIADLAAQYEDLDRDMLSSAVSPHGSGVKALLAPPHPEAAEALLAPSSGDGPDGQGILRTIMQLMRFEFDIVIIDTWSWVDDVLLTVLDSAAMIILLVTPDIPSIKDTRLFLEIAEKLNYSRGDMALVVNRAGRQGIRVEQIAQALLPVAVEIPEDAQALAAAANRGVPLMMRDQSRPVSQGILELADYILGRIQDTGEDTGGDEDADDGGLRLTRLFR
jgi:pilus assembly protein CpaE